MYIHPSISKCTAYDLPYPSGPAEINLAIVENHIDPGPNVLAVLENEKQYAGDLPRYPGNKNAEPRRALVAALRETMSIGPETAILLTHGSDSGLRAILSSFANKTRPARVTFPAPTYPHFLEFARQLPPGTLELGPVCIGQHDDTLSILRKQLQVRNADLVYIVNPSLPFGHVLDTETLRELVRDHPQTLFVVDEAYLHFQPNPGSGALNLADNVVVVRTFSKAYALAATRLGWMAGPTQTMNIIDRFINQKDVSDFSCRLGAAALQDHAYYMAAVAQVMHESRSILNPVPGVTFGPGGNFGLLQLPGWIDPAEFVQRLREKGFLLRNKSSEIAQTLRFTIPPPAVAGNLARAISATLLDQTV